MTTVRTYKDGDRLIIVLENCTGELAQKANAFVMDALGLPGKAPSPTPVPAVIPQTVAEPDITIRESDEIQEEKPFDEPLPLQNVHNIPVSGGSGTLGQAIERKDTAAIVELCVSTKTMAPQARDSVLALCKEYIRNDCLNRDPDYTGSDEIRQFFKEYEPLIQGAIKQILESAGYSCLDDFFDLTDEYIQQDAYSSVLTALISRVS